MGLLDRLRSTAGNIIRTGAQFTPTPIDDLIAGGLNIGGGGGGTQPGTQPRRRQQPRGTTGGRSRLRSMGSGRSRTGRASTLVPTGADPIPDFGIDFGPFRLDEEGFSRDPFDIGPFRFGAGGDEPTTQDGQATGLMGGGGFGQSMAMELLLQSIGDSSTGRALMEAITSGSLQRGVIQSTQTVNTPRGSENHSPPGFRTVYVQDEPFAVFKPLAQALNLLPSGERTHREKLDDAAREYLKRRREFKDLAPKLGLKTSDRKSGPKR